jgi:hypothetical protein
LVGTIHDPSRKICHFKIFVVDCNQLFCSESVTLENLQHADPAMICIADCHQVLI